MKVNILRAPNHRTLRPPIRFSLLPDVWARHAGNIIILWGQIEAHFDDFLAAMLAFNTTAIKKWKGRPFAQRRELFKKEMEKTFGSHLTITTYLGCLLDEIDYLSTFRNMLAHGEIFLYRPPNDFVIVARSYRQEIAEVHLREAEFETLYYEISHLAFKMGQICSPEDVEPLSIPSPDKSFLQEFLRRSPSIRTSDATPIPPPLA